MVIDILKKTKETGMLNRGDRVLCALSGGADSSVLLDVLATLCEELGITVAAAHLNHLLRGDDAMSDEAFVRKRCEEYGIELVCERIDINALSRETGESTELCARNARYAFLRRAAEKVGANKIATAHNANDNLETMLFNLARGSGTDGLCGIPPVRGDIIRPLIYVSRAEIERYAEERGLSFCVDKTNFQTVYSRNKLRHEALPALLGVNPAAVENASRAAGILRSESEYISLMANESAKKIATGENSCDAKELLALHPALFARVCESFAKAALGKMEYTLEYCHTASIRALCESGEPSGEIALPAGLRARREYEKLIFETEEEKKTLGKFALCEGEFMCDGFGVKVKKIKNRQKIHKSLNTFLIPCDKIEGDLVLRARANGDEIKLQNRPAKSIKKLFIEARVPKYTRENIPVIADEKKVFAIYGFGQDERLLPEVEADAFEIEIN